MADNELFGNSEQLDIISCSGQDAERGCRKEKKHEGAIYTRYNIRDVQKRMP